MIGLLVYLGIGAGVTTVCRRLVAIDDAEQRSARKIVVVERADGTTETSSYPRYRREPPPMGPVAGAVVTAIVTVCWPIPALLLVGGMIRAGLGPRDDDDGPHAYTVIRELPPP